MSNWTLWTTDLALDNVPTSAPNVNSPANCFNGYDSMFMSPSTTPVTITLATLSGSVGAVAVANHDTTGTTTINIGNGAHTLTAYIDQGWTEASRTPNTIIITNGTSKRFGCISLLSDNANHKIVLTNCWPVYPIGQSYGVVVSEQVTGGGQIIRQRRGGAFKTFSLRIPYANITSGTSNTEGVIEQSFINQLIGGAGNTGYGWTSPMWVQSDADIWYHVQMQYPIVANVTTAGGRAELQLNFRQIPKSGLV